MSNDFMPAERFKKGVAKVDKLEAWQSKDEKGVVIQNKQRCWDGLFGCEQYFFKSDFRWHPRICNNCSVALSHQYSVSHSKIDFLLVLLWQDSSMHISIKKMNGNPERITALEKMREKYIHQLFESVLKVVNSGEQKKVNADFRKWFFEYAEVKESKKFVNAENLKMLENVV